MFLKLLLNNNQNANNLQKSTTCNDGYKSSDMGNPE